MEKLSKCKQYVQEFGVSVLTGTAVLSFYSVLQLVFIIRCFYSVSGSASGVYFIYYGELSNG